jgi:hypothetical protein
MTKILINNKGIIILKGAIEALDNGFTHEGVFYGPWLELQMLEIEDGEYGVQTHKYIDGVISLNENYEI